MDRYTLQQTIDQVDELLRHGSPSCIRQANSIMIENFEIILRFALELTKPEPKPKRTIADNYPAGGLTATEPCMFCEDFGKLEERIKELEELLAELHSDVALETGSQWAIDNEDLQKRIEQALKG